MGLFKRAVAQADDITPTSSSPERVGGKDEILYEEHASTGADTAAKWKVSKAGDGDVAMALFSSPSEIHEPIDPVEERKVVRKIDFMILPYLAVCYAFFYIDKTTLSYAAIFGIKDDLDLVGKEYSWLSSYVTTIRSSSGAHALTLPKHLLLRLPGMGASHQSFDAATTDWQIPWLQHLPMGCVPHDPSRGQELRWPCRSACIRWCRRSLFRSVIHAHHIGTRLIGGMPNARRVLTLLLIVS